MNEGFSRGVALEGRNDSMLEHQPKARKSFLYRYFIKRLLDVTLILASAPFTVPVVFVLAVMVWAQGGQPFYTQSRIGYKGREFRIWKLRSMVVDADAVLDRYLAKNPAMKAEWDAKQKLLHDPRITRLGHLMRRTSLDELPQLWNVLKGDMSLVGPRPMMVEQKPLYPGLGYYRLRPGLSGPWQISARHETNFADRAKFDDDYDRKLSFLHDVGIILKTILVVLKATGR